MEQWKEYKLGDLLNFRRGYDLPKTNMVAGKIPVAGSNGVIGFHNIETPIYPCITIGRSGNVGTPYIYDKCWAHNTVLYVDDFKGNNPKYLYYLLKTVPLSSFGGGSAVPTLNRNHIHPILVKATRNQKIQDKLVKVLEALDSKIELNRRINDNLEQQAQALFKAWFVDFEPFKGGEFVDSEFGMIPKDWLRIKFGDFINPSNAKVSNENTPEYSVTNTGIYPRDKKFKKQLGKTSTKNKLLLKNNLVFGMSREILNWGIMEDEVGGVSSAYNIYIINEQLVNPLYLKYFIKERLNYFNDLIGTAAREGQTLDKGALVQKIIYIPPKDILDDFLLQENAIFAMHNELTCEIHNLITQRDLLLPRLMSGELKISPLNR